MEERLRQLMLCIAVIIAVAARLTNAASESESNIIISLQCFQLSRSTFRFFFATSNILICHAM